MLPKWVYFGVHHDPHMRFWLPGMVAAPTMGETLSPDVIAACIPPTSVKPFEVRITLLPDLNATASAFRERWHTQLSPDPVASVFVTTDMHGTLMEALDAASRAFPEVWKRFEKLTAGETCTYSRPSSAPSVSSTSETEQPSKPGKASARSSA